MKYSVFTVMMGPLPMEEVVEKLLRYGYEGVEWRVHREFHLDPENIENDLKEANRICRKAGLEIVGLAPYLQLGSPLLERVVIAAGEFGIPMVRIGVPPYTGDINYWQLYDETRKKLGEFEKIAEKTGVKGVIEIHMGNIATSPSLAKWLLKDFNPRYVGAIFDPGNMVVEGYEAWKMGLEILGSHLAHTHAKNTGWFRRDGKWEFSFVPMDEGIADWKQILLSLKAVGYEGWISFEDFSDLPLDEKLKKNIELCKQWEQD
ncbi:sugar phosphate isomerase/epimerase [bacterium]|nr:sugar phosphate isomerase/epimerase [bacterium]